jgi:putative sigma-54 modulation protein
MRLELTGRHVDITPGLRRLVEQKLGKLERLLNDSAVSAHAVLTRDKHRHLADITLHARGEKFLHGIGASSVWEQSVGQAIEKLTKQARKVKGKWREPRKAARKGEPTVAELREAAAVRSVNADGKRPPSARANRVRIPPMLHASRQALKTMSVTDATRAIDNGSDGVVVFRDLETAAVSVVYRRSNGDLALVQTEG